MTWTTESIIPQVLLLLLLLLHLSQHENTFDISIPTHFTTKKKNSTSLVWTFFRTKKCFTIKTFNFQCSTNFHDFFWILNWRNKACFSLRIRETKTNLRIFVSKKKKKTILLFFFLESCKVLFHSNFIIYLKRSSIFPHFLFFLCFCF